MDVEIKLWIALGVITVGAGLISLLLNRAISQMDDLLKEHGKKHQEHDKDFGDIRERIAKHDAGIEAINTQYSQLREDLREVKNDVKEIARGLAGRTK